MSAEHIVMRLDLQGKFFNIGQDFIDKYPESTLAKSPMLKNLKEYAEPIKIDRNGEYVSKILEYARGTRKAFKPSRMSPSEIKKLMDNLKFLGIEEDLLKSCKRELKKMTQESIEIANSEEHLKEMLVEETRLVLILSFQYLAQDSNQPIVERILKLVDRDKCLVIGCMGEIAGFTYVHRNMSIPENCVTWREDWDSFLCNPMPYKILRANSDTEEDDLLQMVFYANTRHPFGLFNYKFVEEWGDPDHECELFENRLFIGHVIN